MPWTPSDAERHTKAANTPSKRELWAKIANEVLQRTGNEARAIREANAVIARHTWHRPKHKWLAVAVALVWSVLLIHPAAAQTHPAPNSGGGQPGNPIIPVAPTPQFTAPANQWPTGLSQSGWSFGNTVTPAGGNTASPLPNILGRIVTPMDFGAVGDGVTNDTNAVQAAINAVSQAGSSGILFLGNHKYCITGVTISSAIRIVGSGYGGDNGTAPSGFTACAPNPAAMITLTNSAQGAVLEYFGIWPGNAASGSAIVNEGQQNTIHDILIYDACNAIDEIGNSNTYYDLRINGAVQSNCKLIDIGSPTIRSIDPIFTTSTIADNDASGASGTVGMYLENTGGFYITGIEILFMDNGTVINPGAGETVAGGFFENTFLGDTTNHECLVIKTASNTGIIYAVNFDNVWTGSCGQTARNGTASWSQADAINITNPNAGTVNGIYFNGVEVMSIASNGIYVYGSASGSISNIAFDGGFVCGVNETNAGNNGIVIGTNVNNISIRGMTIGASCNNAVGPGVAEDIVLTSGVGSVTITDNNLLDSTLGGSAPSGGVIDHNIGADNLEPPIASAATITAPLSSFMNLTGTTTVTTINNIWPGRTLYIVDGGGAALATGGNIVSVPASFSANQLIVCKAANSNWVCR